MQRERMFEWILEILFKQKQPDRSRTTAILEDFGIEQCFFKYISFESDRSRITRKRHYHASIEIHIIERGYQLYEIGSDLVRIEEGQFLIIPPLVPHITVGEDSHTLKYAFSFHAKENGTLTASIAGIRSYMTGDTPIAVKENIQYIGSERSRQDRYSSHIVCNRVWECIIQFLRLYGITDSPSADSPGEEDIDEDERFLLAKQYIQDNVCQKITVSDLASYCCIGAKQLTRIFQREEGMTVTEYIRKKRCLQIEKLLADPTLSLRAVSEEMNFNNEYYFNAFFKRYAGMSPGAYRRSVLKNS